MTADQLAECFKLVEMNPEEEVLAARLMQFLRTDIESLTEGDVQQAEHDAEALKLSVVPPGYVYTASDPCVVKGYNYADHAIEHARIWRDRQAKADAKIRKGIEYPFSCYHDALVKLYEAVSYLNAAEVPEIPAWQYTRCTMKLLDEFERLKVGIGGLDKQGAANAKQLIDEVMRIIAKNLED